MSNLLTISNPFSIYIQSSAGITYDTDAAAYFARMSVQESDTFKGLFNTCVLSLKSAGLWSGIDWLPILCTTQAANAVYNPRNATKSLTFVNSPTHTPGKGVAGDGTTSYVSFGEAYNAAGNTYSQNLASISAWCNGTLDDGTASHPHIGTESSGATRLLARIGAESGRVNSVTTDTAIRTGTTRLGHRWAAREDSANVTYGYNGTALTPVTKTSSAPSGTATLGRVDTTYTADRIASAYSGSLTPAQMVTFHGIMDTFHTAWGSN